VLERDACVDGLLQTVWVDRVRRSKGGDLRNLTLSTAPRRVSRPSATGRSSTAQRTTPSSCSRGKASGWSRCRWTHHLDPKRAVELLQSRPKANPAHHVSHPQSVLVEYFPDSRAFRRW